jgi:hypothetical protein
MLGWIREKMATLESATGGGKFFASSSTTAGNSASTCSDLCAEVGIVQPPLGTVPRTMHIRPICLAGVKGWAENQVP